MTNEHYSIVSYFLCGLVSLGLGAASYRMLRRPFAAIAEAVVGRRGALLKRTLALSITLAAVLGFVSVNYKECGKSYEQVIEDRSYLVQMNRQQLQGAGDWIVFAVLAWGLVVLICLLALRHREEHSEDQ